MRKQIAAANWKMNLTYKQGEALLEEILKSDIALQEDQQVILAVPFPYLIMAKSEVADAKAYDIAAQNCSEKTSGAYTGEVSAEMLKSIGIDYCIIGHSERRTGYHESNEVLAAKVDQCLQKGITPIFCCGENLSVREHAGQNAFVQKQLQDSLFQLPAEDITKLIIAYEPIWAIGTGKTATTVQIQEMHQHLRAALARQYGDKLAAEISILYGGSVKPSNAVEIFACADVDGGLVGGASLVAQDFVDIIKALKQ